jgi:hypothetical protein
VTEFSCGGFVVGLISVHTIADGLGAGQFINTVAAYARGATSATPKPVWARDVIPEKNLLQSGCKPGCLQPLTKRRIGPTRR